MNIYPLSKTGIKFKITTKIINEAQSGFFQISSFDMHITVFINHPVVVSQEALAYIIMNKVQIFDNLHGNDKKIISKM